MSLRRSHLPGLDGLRALAVISVVCYHFEFGWAKGGYLGVDLFFVLSGFLITSLLLDERNETGRIALLAFWARRARRLLPALFVMLVVVALVPLIVTRWGNPTAVASVDLDLLHGFGLSSFFYFANWYAISSGHSHFAGLTAPSPLAHTWSLAIEEQFYLVWPLLVLGLSRRGVERNRRLGIAVTVAIGLVSSLLMAVLFTPGSSTSINLVYNATYTRLFDLAAGATLAWIVVQRPSERLTLRAANWLGVLSLAVVLAAMVVAGTSAFVPPNFMFQGGFLVCAIVATALVGSVRVEQSWTARLFSLSPLRAVGRVSYGVYLWHWPIIVLVTPALVHVRGWPLNVVQIALMAAATYVSYRFIEMPIRQRRWRIPVRWAVASLGTIVTLLVVVFLTLASVYPTPSLTVELARYAPSTPAVGSGDIVGRVSSSWITAANATSTHPLRVMVMGDSIGYYSGPGIAAALNAMPNVQASVQAFVGTGLRDKSQWKFYLNAVRRKKPEIVMFLNAYDELTALHHPRRYEANVREFTGILLRDGVHDVIFLSTPQVHSPLYLGLTGAAERLWERPFLRANLAWRREVQAVVRDYPRNSLYFPIGRSLELGHRYSPWLPPPRDPSLVQRSWSRVRMVDGVHFCPLGTEIYASALTADLTIALGLKSSSASWWLGSWPSYKLPYYAPTASWCPNDHPS